jgi:hypothetical protein
MRSLSVVSTIVLMLSIGLGLGIKNAKAYSCGSQFTAAQNCYAIAMWGSAVVNGANTEVKVVPQLLPSSPLGNTASALVGSISDELWVKDTTCNSYPNCWIEVGYGMYEYYNPLSGFQQRSGTFWGDRRAEDNSFNFHPLHDFNQMSQVGYLKLDINVESDSSKYMLGIDYLDPNGNYMGSEVPNPESTSNSIHPNYIFIGMALSGSHDPGVGAAGQATPSTFTNNNYHFSGCPTGFFNGCGQYNPGVTFDNGVTYGAVYRPPSAYWAVMPYYSSQSDHYTGNWTAFCC